MGKIKGGVNGNLSGAAGNVVFYSMNGENYFRTLQRRRSKNSWSERQELNRKRFTALSAFWKGFSHTPVEQIWQAAEKGKRAHNLFLSANSPAFAPDGTLADRERLHFSAGQLPLPHRLTAVCSPEDPQAVQVSWQDDPGSGSARPDDELKMIVYQDGNFTGPVATGAFRKEQTALIRLPSGMGTPREVYLFFASDKRKMYSPDQYFKIEN